MEGANLIDGFAEALVREGFTSVPNLLIRSYASLGINNNELVIILHLMYLRSLDGDGYPAITRLQGLSTATASEIEASLADLIEKKIIMVDKRVNAVTGEVEPFYSLEGLFKKLSEIWAIEKHYEIEALKRYQGQRPDRYLPQSFDNLPRIYKTFEKEFGRPFSPMEGELIADWARRYPVDLVLEALRIAVLSGSFNLRYIERILQDWERSNIRTLEEVKRREEEYIEKKSSPRGRKKGSSPRKSSSKEDKTEWNYGW